MGISFVQNGNIMNSKLTMACPVNCVGVMGRGLAKTMAVQVPGLCTAYRIECAKGELTVGTLYHYQHLHWSVLCFPTKINWRDPSDLAWIEKGLQVFKDTYELMDIKGIAFPRLGCGCGQLSWDEVKPLMIKYLSDLPIPVEIYE